jgi:hypothetical protein
MKMNEKENGRGRGVVAAWWVESIAPMVCAKSFSGRTDCRCPSLSAGRHGRRRLAQQHSTNTHPRCAAAVQSLGRLSAPNRPPDECNMSLRNARPVPRRLAS